MEIYHISPQPKAASSKKVSSIGLVSTSLYYQWIIGTFKPTLFSGIWISDVLNPYNILDMVSKWHQKQMFYLFSITLNYATYTIF